LTSFIIQASSKPVVLNLWETPHWWRMAELPSGEWPVGQLNHCFKI